MFLITLGHSMMSGTLEEAGYLAARRLCRAARSRLMSSSTFTTNLARPHSLQ